MVVLGVQIEWQEFACPRDPFLTIPRSYFIHVCYGEKAAQIEPLFLHKCGPYRVRYWQVNYHLPYISPCLIKKARCKHCRRWRSLVTSHAHMHLHRLMLQLDTSNVVRDTYSNTVGECTAMHLQPSTAQRSYDASARCYAMFRYIVCLALDRCDTSCISHTYRPAFWVIVTLDRLRPSEAYLRQSIRSRGRLLMTAHSIEPILT